MKYRILFLGIVCITVRVFSQTSSLPITVETHTSSDGSRNRTELVVTPVWSPTLSSSLVMRKVGDASMGPALDSDPKSLLAVQFDRWEAELTLMRRKVSFLNGNLAADGSLGFAWWNEHEIQKGYFSFGGTAELMAEDTRINYFIPVIGTGLNLRLGSIVIEDNFWISPLFYYTMNQSIAIQPLVYDQYEQTVAGWGKVMLGNGLRMNAFGIFNLSWFYDLTLLDFPFLKLGILDGSATFYPVRNPAMTIGHKILAGFSLPINERTALVVQAGKNFSTAKDIQNDISIYDSTFVWEAALTLR